MEVPAEFKSLLAGIRYKMLYFLFLAAPALLISCGDDVTIIQTINADEPDKIAIFSESAVEENGDGTYSVMVNAMVQNREGNPVEDGTSIFFGLIDNYIIPNDVEQGTDGKSTANTNTFSSDSIDFEILGVVKGDTLVILEGDDKGGYLIEAVENNDLIIDHTFKSDQEGLQFEVGNNFNAYGFVCGSSPEDSVYVYTGNGKLNAGCEEIDNTSSVKGVVHSRLTWREDSIWEPFTLYAFSAGGTVRDAYQSIFPDFVDPVISITFSEDRVYAGTEDLVVTAKLTQRNIPMSDQQLSFTTSDASVADFKGAPSVIGVTDAWGEAESILDTYLNCTDTNVLITAEFNDIESSGTLNIIGVSPVVNFDIDATAAPSYTFTSTSMSPVSAFLTCEWDFGDGNTGTGCSVGHVYLGVPGDYTYVVSLTVTDDTAAACENSTTKPINFTIPEPAL